jgi:hypothetical protein
MDYNAIVSELRKYKPNHEESRRKSIEQLNKQKNYSSLCSKDLLNRIRYRIGSLDPKIIKRIITSKFYEYELMKMIECLFASIIEINYNVPSNRMLQYILELDKVIGKKSAYGYAIITDFENEEGLFVTKISKGDANDLIHEAFIGMNIINKLRQWVPNFVYTVGTFNCSYPILSEKGFVETWCNLNMNKQYIVYENVAPSKSFKSMLHDISTEEYISYYLQVLLAIREAYLRYGFTHYDLHTENVLIRQLDNHYAIEYNTRYGKRYIETDQLAVIIDFGQSRAELNGVSYGFYGLERSGNLPTLANPIFDAYKFLMFSLETLLDSNLKVFIDLSRVYHFFSDADVIEEVKKQRKLYYVLPPNTANIRLDDYINYIVGLFPNVLKERTRLPLLKSTMSEDQAFDYLHLSNKVKLLDFLDLYDMTTDTTRFDYSDYHVDRNLAKYANILHGLKTLVLKFVKYPVTASYDLYIKSLDEFITYVGVYDTTKYYVNIIGKLAIEYNDVTTAQAAKSLNELIDSIHVILYKYALNYECTITNFKRRLTTGTKSLSQQNRETTLKLQTLNDIELCLKILSV